MSDIFLLLFLVSLVGLFFGLKKPQPVLSILPSLITKGAFTKQKAIQIFGTAAVVFYILFSLTKGSGNTDTSTILSSSVAKPTDELAILIKGDKELFRVLKIIDGDTIDVEIEGRKETIRLIGIDSPETVDPRKPVQCFGQEASKKAKEVLSGKVVSLEVDPTQGGRDKYNRLLRYVFLEDGTNFNKLMISEGYAYEYTYQAPYKYQEEFIKAQREAESNKKGLWADGACQPTPTPTKTKPKTVSLPTNTPIPSFTVATPAPQLPTSTPIPQPTSTPQPPPPTAVPTSPPQSSGGGSYTCDCSKTCTQITTCEEAYFQLNQCGCQKRDGDNDGVPCESLCR